jgi:GntR family transcriptional regulator
VIEMADGRRKRKARSDGRRRKPARTAAGDRRPLYQQIAQKILEMIRELAPGSFLPSEPALAKQLGISRATLREAMRGIEDQGLIVRRQGIGTYVARPGQAIEAGLEVMESIESMAKRLGLNAEMRRLRVDERLAEDEEAALLQIAPHTAVLEISRIMLVADRPVAYLVDILPHGLLSRSVVEGAFSGSIFDLLLQRGWPRLAYTRTNLTALAATHQLALSLQVRRGAPLIYLNSCLFDVEGKVVAHTHSYFVPGPFRFHVIRRVT